MITVKHAPLQVTQHTRAHVIARNAPSAGFPAKQTVAYTHAWGEQPTQLPELARRVDIALPPKKAVVSASSLPCAARMW